METLTIKTKTVGQNGFFDLRNQTNIGFIKLSKLVIDFNGDRIAECFKNQLVKKVADCNETTMFQTIDGKLFSLYTSKLTLI